MSIHEIILLLVPTLGWLGWATIRISSMSSDIQWIKKNIDRLSNDK